MVCVVEPLLKKEELTVYHFKNLPSAAVPEIPTPVPNVNPAEFNVSVLSPLPPVKAQFKLEGRSQTTEGSAVNVKVGAAAEADAIKPDETCPDVSIDKILDADGTAVGKVIEYEDPREFGDLSVIWFGDDVLYCAI